MSWRDYPPEFDGPVWCEVCDKNVSHPTTECKCPECPECGEVGNPACYPAHGLEVCLGTSE
jgi:hypothetical protein